MALVLQVTKRLLPKRIGWVYVGKLPVIHINTKLLCLGENSASVGVAGLSGYTSLASSFHNRTMNVVYFHRIGKPVSSLSIVYQPNGIGGNLQSPFVLHRYSTAPPKEPVQEDNTKKERSDKVPKFLIYNAKKGWHFFVLTILSSSQLGIWLAEKMEGSKRREENPSLLARNLSSFASIVGLVCLFLVFWYSRNFISEVWVVGQSAQRLIIRTYTIIGTKTAPKQILTKNIVKGRVKKNSNYVGVKLKGARFSYILDKNGRFIANEDLINSFENGASSIFVTWSRVYPSLKQSASTL